MKITLLTYADKHYYGQQQALSRRARELQTVDEVIEYTRGALTEQTFYTENKAILDQERGAGFWLWKPYIILDALKGMANGDVIVYIDSGDWLSCSFRKHLENWADKLVASDLIFTDGSAKQSNYCKRDTFVIMGMDEYQYHNTIQLEAGMIVVRKSDYSMNFLKRWLDLCKDDRLLTDKENTCGLPNLPGFLDHRHDQAILTLLVRGLRLPSSSEMRQFINGNQNPVNFL